MLVRDVAGPEQVEQAASQVEEQWGAIDVWVNNAMTSVFSPLNLWESVPGPFNARGRFDDSAKENSPQFWLVKQKWNLATIAAAGAAFATVLASRRVGSERGEGH